MTTLYDAKNNKIGIIDSFDVLNGNLLEIVLINGCTMHFAPGDIIRDDPYGWHIRYGSYDKVPCKHSRQSTERAKKNDIVRFGMCNVSIRKVIFNEPTASFEYCSTGKLLFRPICHAVFLIAIHELAFFVHRILALILLKGTLHFYSPRSALLAAM